MPTCDTKNLVNPLSNAENAAISIWLRDLDTLLGRSQIRVRRPFITLKVVENRATQMDPSANWLTITITRDCLTLVAPTGPDADLRKYFLAHELGHVEGQHTAISMLGALCIIPGFLWLMQALAPKVNFPWSSLFWFNFALGVLGTLVIIAYQQSMLFEWNADKRGARITSSADMEQGITEVLQYRKIEDHPYYQNKSDKLSGGEPSFWKFK